MDFLLKERKIENLPNILQEDIHKISIGNNPYLIGSGSIQSLTYNSDFDLNEKIIVKDLKSHIQQLKKERNIWIISVHNTKEYIQINTICNIYNLLLDVNDTIFVNFQPSKKNKQKTLKEDIHKLINEGNFFKALKRLYTLLSLDAKKNIKLIYILTDFLNSNIGLLQNIINQLDIISNFVKVERNRNEIVNFNLEYCRFQLNKVYVVPIEEKLYKMFKLTEINKLKTILSKKVQEYTKKWVDINRKLLGI
jgi:hypothetical protein